MHPVFPRFFPQLSISLAVAANVVIAAAHAQSVVASKPLSSVLPSTDVRKLPPQLLPDLAIVASSAMNPNSYLATIKNEKK